MLPCACGQSARYAGRHGKNFESVLGLLRLERAYYHCELCEAGFCPRDRVLGLEGGSLSPGVLRMAGPLGWPLFPTPAWPGQRLLPYLAQTWHSKIAIRDENRE